MLSSAEPALPASRARLPAGSGPALLALVFTLGVVLLRPPLPIDETRYLEVFRESGNGRAILLRLLGEPYAEKPPLLFWLGGLLGALGVPASIALRCVPPLATAALVLVVARIGRRAGLALAGWCQAALLLPLLAGQLLLFDPLLALAVWCALDAWTRRRDGALAAWSAAALLAKGPVALLFLAALLWSTLPLRERRPGDARRATLALVVALLPLATWALTAARLGGPEFANALLWDRWASRVAGKTDHERSLFFYVPVVLLGALPGTFVLLRRSASEAPTWARRLLAVTGALFVCFTLFHGKQAHYLVPLAPALALLLAERLETSPRTLAHLRWGAAVQLALFAVLGLAGLFVLPLFPEPFGTDGRAWLAGGAWRVPLAFLALAALAGLASSWRARSARAVLAIVVASSGAALVSLHGIAGKLLFPHALADALAADGAAPVAYVGTRHHGLYDLLADREGLEKLVGASELSRWSAAHPGGLLLIEPDERPEPMPEELVRVTEDTVHRSPVEVWRVAVRSLAGRQGS